MGLMRRTYTGLKIGVATANPPLITHAQPRDDRCAWASHWLASVSVLTARTPTW
jgi:hypothetical protein